MWRLPVPKTPLAEAGGLAFAVGVVVTLWLGLTTTRLRHRGVPIPLTSGAMGFVVGLLWLWGSGHLPNKARNRRDLLPGAVLIGVAAPALNLAVQLYFAPKLARTTATYGVLGASLVILTYLLVVAWMIILSAELNAGVLEWRLRDEGEG